MSNAQLFLVIEWWLQNAQEGVFESDFLVRWEDQTIVDARGCVRAALSAYRAVRAGRVDPLFPLPVGVIGQ